MTSTLNDGYVAEVLLVEDNENDVLLTEHAFRKAKSDVNLRHVGDGIQCMNYLRKEGRYAEVLTPDLILLDLNMPLMDGRAVLSEIAGDSALRHLPVVILTTSSDEQEIRAMYALRCNSYIVKPVDFVQFQRVISVLMEYWFTAVVLPTSVRRGVRG